MFATLTYGALLCWNLVVIIRLAKSVWNSTVTFQSPPPPKSPWWDSLPPSHSPQWQTMGEKNMRIPAPRRRFTTLQPQVQMGFVFSAKQKKNKSNSLPFKCPILSGSRTTCWGSEPVMRHHYLKVSIYPSVPRARERTTVSSSAVMLVLNTPPPPPRPLPPQKKETVLLLLIL